MKQNVDDDSLASFLEPVQVGSFSLSSQSPNKTIYASFPSVNKSKMWDYSITEDGKGERVLSFLVDNKTLNFKLQKPEQEGNPIGAFRLPDSESDDFGVGGNSYSGRVQIHKANPDRVVGTFQTGRTNMSFELQKNDNDQWTIVPRKDPQANIATFVKTITNSKKADDTQGPPKFIENLFYPLTGGWGGVLAAAGLGAGAGALYGGYKRLTSNEPEENKPSILNHALLGAGLGGIASGGIQLFGPRFMPEEEKARMADNMNPSKGFTPSKEFFTAPSYLDMAKSSSEKVAFGSGNQEVDLIALQSILGADPTLTQGDRNILMNQARTAMRNASGGQIDVSRLKGMGLGMLVGYILSKLAGFGTFGTIATTAIGGMIGGSKSKGGPTWNPKGYYTY